jgi:hypothetical protein
VIDRQAIVRGIVAVQIDQQLDAVPQRQVRIPRARAFRRLVASPRRLLAAYGQVQELVVVGQQGHGWPVGVVAVRTGQRNLLCPLPDLVVELSVQKWPGTMEAGPDWLGRQFGRRGLARR